ncbi:hypothetical protein SeMB42_g04692 [Synchytrium endobioticum]|uniref:Uncharacterized protein n=1 Tax=Synchytrium endobioticum TaxID=286115 RepID=A0A507CWH3_9FUNG|nr:hypothetical protein SeMB42_g04692 [Synchytrium endobioticum]
MDGAQSDEGEYFAEAQAKELAQAELKVVDQESQINAGQQDSIQAKTTDNLVSMTETSPTTFFLDRSSAVHPGLPLSQSRGVSRIQEFMRDDQQVAYLCLCRLSVHELGISTSRNKAKEAYDSWAREFIQRLYLYLGVPVEERKMYEMLAERGLTASDVSKPLLSDAQASTERMALTEDQRQIDEQAALDQGLPLPDPQPIADAADVRYTLLSHLFMLATCDGKYDARARILFKTVASCLNISLPDVVKLEIAFAARLKLYENAAQVKEQKEAVEERNKKDGKARWLTAGIATVAGGALLGLTAGLAAPLITASLAGTALSGFMASTGGLALFTTSSVLAGGGMSGWKMLKRTRGISQFEFIAIDEGVEQYVHERDERRARKAVELQTRVRKRRKLPRASSPSIAAEPISHTVTPGSDGKNVAEQVNETGYKPDDETGSESEPGRVSENTLTTSPHPASFAPVSSGTEADLLSSAGTRNEGVKQANVLISIVGYILYGQEDHVMPFSVLRRGFYGDHYALVWETKTLQELGASMNLLYSEMASYVVAQGLQYTILPSLMLALSGPLWVMKLTCLVDNPWVQENRPVTLIGFSVGAQVIYACLTELAHRGMHGIIEDVYIFGAPVMASASEWEYCSQAVAGKIVNGYLNKDWVLTFLYRASMGVWKDVAGLRPIEGVAGLENVCLDDVIDGHLAYRNSLPKILKHVGYDVISETFDNEDEEGKREREMVKEEREALKQEELAKREAELKSKEEEREREKDVAEQKRQEKAFLEAIAKKEKAFKEAEAQLNKDGMGGERTVFSSRPVKPQSSFWNMLRKNSSDTSNSKNARNNVSNSEDTTATREADWARPMCNASREE